MLTRQKVLLALLQGAGRPLHRTRLVKIAFLLRQESRFREEPSFYDFVPYKYGPFSFALFRELGALQRDGIVELGETQAALAPGTEETVSERVGSLPKRAREAVQEALARYGSQPQDELLRDVYRRYPWYGTRSERTDLLLEAIPEPPATGPAVYTAGYEGRSVDAFFDHLLRHGIQGILDVRANPFSRKYGFCGKPMADIATKLGLEYRHFPQMGIPGELRADLSDEASYDRLFARYEREILPSQPQGVRTLAALMRKRPSVLVCMERDARFCHRGRLAGPVAEESGLDVVHL